MTFARKPDSGERSVVLRPLDPALALRRLAEWNAVLDQAAIPENTDFVRTCLEARAKDVWIAALKEQQWTFEGFLDDTGRRVLGHDGIDRGAFQAGDWMTEEKAFSGWKKNVAEAK